MKTCCKMKVTKLIQYALLSSLSFFGCEKMERDIYDNSDGRFVRFNLMVNNDGYPADPGKLNPEATVVSLFNNRSIQTLAIPVTLTSEALEETVTVDYSLVTTGNYSGFSIQPENQLSFIGNQLTDTLYITFHERWDPSEKDTIKLKLESVSDPEIQIGFPSEYDSFDELCICMDELNLRYYIQYENQLEITGLTGETLTFDVLFPDGMFFSELQDTEFFSIEESEFDFSIEMLDPLPGDNKISFRFTLNEDINIDNFSFKTVLALNPLENYLLAGYSKISFLKNELFERDNSVFTASHFYNLQDPFYRTYGENWLYEPKDGVCEWSGFNAFTFPVVVDSEHPNAGLYSDMGTDDPTDDIYHHAFRIGFNTTNPGNTINSFNLKRWFNNESTSSENSPGFNIPQALEFFPANGNSTSEGLVRVIEQDLIIAGTNGNSYTISIEGEGVYRETDPGIYEITLELRASQDELFGGTRTSHYVIYNTKDYIEPLPVTSECFDAMDL